MDAAQSARACCDWWGAAMRAMLVILRMLVDRTFDLLISISWYQKNVKMNG
jgi:hypothetical protein